MKSVPILRFKEFKLGWEEKSFGKVTQFINGKAYSQSELLNDGKYRVLRVGNLFSNNEWYYSDLELDIDKYIESGDLIYAWSASFGPRFWQGEKVIYHYHIWKVIPNESLVDKTFLFHVFAFDVEKIKAVSQGGTMFHVTKGNIESRLFKFPSLPEQQKIASFLSSVDTKIQQLTKKKELLEQYKKGMMQQLFSGKLRFKDENGNAFPRWEEKKIGEDCNILMCKRIFAEQTSITGDIPFYKIGTIGGAPDTFISKELFDDFRNKYNYPRVGEVLITCSGTVGKCIPFDGQDAYYQDSNIVWIDNPHLNILNEFLFYILTNVNWGKLNSTTITRIYGPDLRNLVVNYPKSKNEQQKIASYLSALDAKIKSVAAQIAHTQMFKKGLLQQMFV